MAFSETQKIQLRMYLGWSDRFFQTDQRLERAFNAVESRPDTQILIEVELARMVSLDTQMTNAAKRFKAHKVGSIELQGPTELGLLRSQGRAAAGRVAAILGVEIRHDAFSGTGPRDYASYDGMQPGIGNMIPHA